MNTNTQTTALIVDDEPDIRELLEITLGRMNLTTRSAENIQDAKHLLASQTFSVCLTDLHLPDGNGIELVQHVQNTLPNLPIAVITAFGSMNTAISAMKAGAFDYLNKPIELHQLRELVQNALQLQHGPEPSPSAPTGLTSSAPALPGQSKCMQTLNHQIKKVARSQAAVHISGESGSGKELVARQIHQLSPRCNGPFIPVNCGAIPTELMESEFFGHKKGSFTGAIEDKIGLFQAAHTGTLFLDEVADLPLAMQVKLLRAIQEKKIRPVGSQKEVPVNIRLLSATHKNLYTLVQHEHFRQDLYYRINVIQLDVPPLRDRIADIPGLAQTILNKLCNNWEISPVTLPKDTLSQLTAYGFPGNVRELENILERSLTLCETDTITPAQLQLPDIEKSKTETVDTKIPLYDGNTSLETFLNTIEKDIIVTTLEKHRWNRTQAAKQLGMTMRSLRYRLEKLNINDERHQ